jgi:hypothetical protein
VIQKHLSREGVTNNAERMGAAKWIAINHKHHTSVLDALAKLKGNSMVVAALLKKIQKLTSTLEKKTGI